MLKISKVNYHWIKKELQDDEIIVCMGEFLSPYNKPIFNINNLWSFLLIAGFFIFFWPVIFVIFLFILFLLFKFIKYLLFKFILKTNNIYIITNIRAIALNDTGIREFTSYYPDQFENIEWRKKPNGSGDIIFRKKIYQTKFWRPSIKKPGFTNIAIEESGFMNITNVTKVMDLLKKLSESNHQYNWSAE